MKEVILPKFGFTLEESTIVEWLVSEGDSVEEGDPIVEVSTDKTNMEVEAPVSGIVAGIQFGQGDVVPVTQIIAYILAPGERLPEQLKPTSAKAQTQSQGASNQVTGNPLEQSMTPVAARMVAEKGVSPSAISGSGQRGKIVKSDVVAFLAETTSVNPKVRATPAARRLAREMGIDLATIVGSGANGRIQATDLEMNQHRQVVRDPEPTDKPQAIPLSNMRRAIANNLQSSWQQAPHIMFSAEMEMTAVLAFVAEYDGVNLTAVLTKIVAWTLTKHPAVNAHLIENDIFLHDDVHIGMAVALDEGLIVPVLRSVNQMGIQALTQAIKDIASRAREGRLRANEMGGATFSISNLGMYGIDHFTAIINPPEVGILAIGGVRREFRPNDDGTPVLKSVATMTLSVDHRVVDGAVAAQFMADLRKVIAHPARMLL
ncbi:MAG: dihydrolipoamide acetyltransferase family protein [Chloroflexota bacterium]